jgi:hypothetical protein
MTTADFLSSMEPLMLRCAVLFAVLLAPATLGAQPQVDALGSCLADSTTGKDRKDLATWMFLGMAAHPDIRQYAAPTASADAEASAKVMGTLVTRLLTENCAAQTKAVMADGGSAAMEAAFGRLGQLAMQELMAAPEVSSTMGIFEKHLDQAQFMKLAAGQ